MNNIILLGMPWVGKSTIGRLLALKTKRPFLDTDEYIFVTTGKDPAEHFLSLSPEESLKKEVELISEIEIYSSIISISGSLPLTESGKRLIQQWWNIIIKLDAPLDIIKTRIKQREDGDSRIIFWEHEKSIDDLYHARQEHYNAIMTYGVQCDKSIDEVIDNIVSIIKKHISTSQNSVIPEL